jgi:hypothetical protein
MGIRSLLSNGGLVTSSESRGEDMVRARLPVRMKFGRRRNGGGRLEVERERLSHCFVCSEAEGIPQGRLSVLLVSHF